MSKRKVISFGKSSYVVSLPKNWVLRNNIKKGDEINIEETFDMLVLSTEDQSSIEEETRIKRIEFDSLKRKVNRKIIAAYMNNYDVIEIHGSDLSKHLDEIKQVTQNLVALEIMELGPKKVIIKDFLNTNDISLDSIVKRIDMIIRAMIEETKEAFQKDEKIDLDSRDKDINRLFYVGNKLINKVLNSPRLSKEMNMPIKDLLFKYKILSNFEKLGDQLKRIIRIANNLSCKEEKLLIRKAFNTLAEEYSVIIKALYKIDKDVADSCLQKRNLMFVEFEKMLDLIPSEECENPGHISNITFIVEKFKRFESGVCNIAKAIIEHE
ncbi:phosphate uptake regulator PhoU [Candidatus Woesearchaeota archaeon]|nr:phosphate uptake regulator PhoU [Candidatus Woesearchaeota archaeon]